MTVVQLLVVSTSQLVFSHAWSTGPIHCVTDDRPAISWTCRREHLSILPIPPSLSPHFPPGQNSDSHSKCPRNNGILAETASTVSLTDLHSLSLLKSTFYSSTSSVNDPAVESSPCWILRRTTVSIVFSSA